jgi:hypothetical protein
VFEMSPCLLLGLPRLLRYIKMKPLVGGWVWVGGGEEERVGGGLRM